MMRLFFGHNLDFEIPDWVFLILNRAEQSLLIPLAGLPDFLGGFSIGIKRMTLAGFEMELHPEPLTLRIDKAIGM